MAESIEKELSIIFADVCGSTKLYEQYGDQIALEVINVCVAVMKKAVADHHGRVIKTIGDEVMAVFNTPVDANNACVQMQTEITRLDPKKQHDLVLAIRVGYYHGNVLENVDDGDVFGDAVNIANKVAGLAKAGCILTSDNVRKLLPESPMTTSTKPFATLSVKGREEPLEIYKIKWNTEDNDDSDEDVSTIANTQSILELTYGGKVVKVGEASPKITIGRATDSHIVLNQSSASRNHARIEYRSGTFVLVDKSTNGTAVLSSEKTRVHLLHQEFVLNGEGQITAGKGDGSPESMISFKIYQI